MLKGVHPELKDFIELEASDTDSFWSEELEYTLDEYWNDNPEEAVKKTLDVWIENVKNYIKEVLGPMSALPEVLLKYSQELDNPNITLSRSDIANWRSSAGRIKLSYRKELITHLCSAAMFGLKKDISPGLLIQAAIKADENSSEGRLIEVVGIPWKMIIHKLKHCWQTAYEIDPRQWEELVAGAFDRAGYDEVILTPRSNDRGRDVIAVKKGVGSIRVVDSVKAYKPGHLVRHDDVRALMGVLQGDLKASKGIVTTTSSFAPNISKDPFIAPLIPYRLELMDGIKLKKWLIELAK